MQYYQEVETRFADDPILQLIRSLPTPMILGIDRRSTELFENESMVPRHRRLSRRRDNIFRTSLLASLEEAIFLAEREYRIAESRRLRLAEKLRQQIVKNALTYDDKVSDLNLLKLDLNRVEQLKIMALKTLPEIGLQEEFVTTQLDTFFDKLTYLLKKIPDFDIEEINRYKDPELMNAFIEFMIKKPQFDRIVNILDLVDEHVKEIQGILDPVQRYLSAIDSFLGDANKRLFFNSNGDLSVEIKYKTLDVTSLSSGECQLVVILTHLAFNPDAKRANVFIIDEPELSLHVKWQEEFVTALQHANPDLQLILATHSPSIVLDRIEYCVDLSENVR